MNYPKAKDPWARKVLGQDCRVCSGVERIADVKGMNRKRLENVVLWQLASPGDTQKSVLDVVYRRLRKMDADKARYESKR
jgi:hypothetical protein